MPSANQKKGVNEMGRFSRGALCVLAGAALVMGGCADEESTSDVSTDGDTPAGESTVAGATRVLEVPDQYQTIGDAIEVAKSGDLVLLSPGVYKESVDVEVEDITIRGLDRNEVIIDGEHTRENGIRVLADNVAIENLTVRNHKTNGIWFTGDYGAGVTLDGYRASHITAYNNGKYGVYAFNATRGQFDNLYGSGHADSAFYVGQCNPCDAVLTDVIAESNMLGYSGSNSTGVTIVNSVWRKNRAGIVPNSIYTEELYPNEGTTIVGNLVEDNSNALTPLMESLAVAYGNGIVLGGVSNNVVERNLIRNHANTGVVIADLPDTENEQKGLKGSFLPKGNKVRDNVVEKSGLADLAFVLISHGPAEAYDNCFAGNTFTSSSPANIQTDMPCDGTPASGWDLAGPLANINLATEGPVSYDKMPAPTDLPDGMDSPESAERVSASKVTGKVADLDSIAMPKG